jgi:uncharacterized protein with HEPN domain
MRHDSLHTKISIIRSNLERLAAIPQASFEAFAADFRNLDSAPIFGFRNRIVHLYDRIDERIIYRILREQRDDLAELLDRLLASIERAPGTTEP